MKGSDDIAAAYARRGQQMPAGHARTSADDRLARLEQMEAELDRPLPAAGTRALIRNAPGPEARREFSSFGEFVHAVVYDQDDQRLTSLFHEVDIRGEQRMDDGPSGGFAIPVQFRNELLQVEQSPAVMRPRALVLPPGTPPDAELTFPALDQSAATNMYGGVVFSWIGEGGQKPETGFKVRQVSVRPQEIAGFITITDKLLRNWAAADSFLSTNFRKAIAAAEDKAFLTGNGVAKPLGVLNANATISVSRATPNEITYADVLSMEETLLGTGPNAFFVTSKKGRTWLRQLQNPAGYYIWQENARNASPPMLLSHPVLISDRVPEFGSKGDLMLIDPDCYVIKDGSGPFIVASQHVHFTTNETVIKAFWNVDGQPWMKDPVKTENGDIQSPFIVLN